MNSFISVLKDRKSQRLQALEAKLQQEYEEEIDKLNLKLAKIKADIKKLDQEQKTIQQSTADLAEYLHLQDTVIQHLRQSLLKIFSNTTSKFFAKKPHHETWIQSHLDLIPSKPPGVITSTITSAKIVNQLTDKNPHQIKIDKKTTGIGFIFESDHYIIDARIDTFIKDQYPQLEAEMARLLDYQELA